jgi:hypothetical protein
LPAARDSAKIEGMSQQPNAVTAPLSTPLARALDQNETVQESVEQSADELLLINTVLKQEIPDHIQTDAVAQALQQGGELEGKIQESAENLAQVNQALEQEIAERVELERELADTKAALAEAQSQPSAQ